MATRDRDPTCGMALHFKRLQESTDLMLAISNISKRLFLYITSMYSDAAKFTITVYFTSRWERDFILRDKELQSLGRVTRLESMGDHPETPQSRSGASAERQNSYGHATSGHANQVSQQSMVNETSIPFVSTTVLDYIYEKIQIDDIPRKKKVTFLADKENMILTLQGEKQNITSATNSVLEALKGVSYYEISMEGIDKLKMLTKNKGNIDKSKYSKLEIIQSCQKVHPVGIKCRVVLPGGRILSVFEGDVREHHVDAMVTIATNPTLKGKQDVTQSGGLAVRNQIDAVLHSSKEGDCLITGPGDLPCKILIHAVGPPRSTILHQNMGIEEFSIPDGIIKLSLREAHLRGFNSITIPTVLAQQYGFGDDACAQGIVTAIVNYCKDENYQGRSVRDIRVVDKEGNIAKIIADNAFTIHHRWMKPLQILLPSIAVNETIQSITTSNGQTIALVHGSLEEEQTNTIVNSTGETGSLAKGAVSKALLHKAGPDLQKELTEQLAGKLLQEGQGRVTTGCKLGCTSVFHVMVFNNIISSTKDLDRAEKILKEVVQICLRRAQYTGQKSISFPALGAGTLKHPVDMVATTMINTVIDHFNAFPNSSLKNVRFVLYPTDEEPIREFKKMFALKKDDVEKMHGNTSYVFGASRSEKLDSSPVTVIQMAGNASDVSQARVEIERLVGKTEGLPIQSPASGAIVKQPMTQPSATGIQQSTPSGGASGGMLSPTNDFSRNQESLSSMGAHGGTPSSTGKGLSSTTCLPDEGEEAEALRLDPKEYSNLEVALKECNFDIKSFSKVETLYNRILEDAFGNRLSWLCQRDQGPITCRMLFQGINNDESQNIQRSGFKRALPGKNGHPYGRGIYFHTDVQKALTHGADGGVIRAKFVVVAKVMTGKYCLGKQGMLVPPPIQQSDPTHLYDSTVDNCRSPNTFVVFNPDQAYPLFLLRV